MGVKVEPYFFVAMTILIVVAQLTVFRFARRAGLVTAKGPLSWTKSRMLALGSMAIFACLALIIGFFAFAASYIEAWQVLWPCAAVLVLAGLAGLVATGRLFEGPRRETRD
jgi:hypothetical protein